MIAANILSNNMIPLRTSDTGDEALSIMSDFYIKHLPIVNDKQLLGLLSEDDILENDVSEPIGSYHLSLQYPYVREDNHLYEVMRLIAELDLTVIPVVDRNQNYIGMISLQDLLNYFAQTGSFTEPGGIIVLEVQRRDYSLSEIARLVESEQAAILSSFISSSLDASQSLVHVTIKVNRQHTSSIVATLQRFGYEIKATFGEREMLDGLQERFDSLMSYLNV
ncbi:MAG: CBS domain-containing protein [Saprospiraceae bacterium]|nr:CBS domain-containing protein [Saprospiraceae bacterium]